MTLTHERIIFTLSKLKRSNDRKVANAVSKNGKTPAIANTFGLPAGKDFSCPKIGRAHV